LRANAGASDNAAADGQLVDETGRFRSHALGAWAWPYVPADEPAALPYLNRAAWMLGH
jgi:hypothetical protein